MARVGRGCVCARVCAIIAHEQAVRTSIISIIIIITIITTAATTTTAAATIPTLPQSSILPASVRANKHTHTHAHMHTRTHAHSLPPPILPITYQPASHKSESERISTFHGGTKGSGKA
ncbi:hypothetical protein K431DRAFT_65566 [Polychaeton citri CBS 116435]|uniref:Uncharacterized protein n=1 Tax=Polychaeton citri CBS 116435 TaxID=1314669 RepID=A0A9P4UQL6_9PEZI|nr:hypothetical protein K431DRAFT_65566 [Polychaeton citri CBS 116435]